MIITDEQRKMILAYLSKRPYSEVYQLIAMVVGLKPKSNGKYTIPKTNLDSFDWDMWLRDKPNYTPIEDEKAGLGDIEQDLANEYWQEQYQKYLRNGGTLDFKKYMQMQMQNKISKEVDKRVKDKMQTEGLAAILGVPGNKI